MYPSQNDAATQDTTENRAPETQDTGSRSDGDDAGVLDAQLPAELRSAFGRFVGRESVDTLGEWADEIRRRTGGGSIAVEQLCHVDEETDHWGIADDERYYFRCFYDAVILAALEDRPVEIHTESPGGTVVEARAVGSDELSVTPETSVFSLGIEPAAWERSEGNPTVQDGYAAICPYVRAFPDRDAYERWAADVPGATVAMPLAGATDVARALVA